MKGAIAQISIWAARLCHLNQEKKESVFNSLSAKHCGGGAFFISSLQSLIAPLRAGIAPEVFRILWPQSVVVRVSGNAGYRLYLAGNKARVMQTPL